MGMGTQLSGANKSSLEHNQGLEIAISNISPNLEHRNCARHMFANWLGRKLGKSYEYMVFGRL
ncbi:hypothetical protein PVK06_036842 [Gossypium arboreum]|uniref:Uncharacterized protein n=1 Tax=Gossypium arboreum TaxID=29729 RepID=A0ABR0NNQ5_GOSAR|nr:hypothetical protein PVK06_036842 [Gossypium arboreum]